MIVYNIELVENRSHIIHHITLFIIKLIKSQVSRKSKESKKKTRMNEQKKKKNYMRWKKFHCNGKRESEKVRGARNAIDPLFQIISCSL